MNATEDYLGRVHALLWAAAEFLSAGERSEVQHLIDSGEPAEGLRSLAWIIVDGGLRVPASVIASIRELSEGFVAVTDLPPNLDDHGLPEQ